MCLAFKPRDALGKTPEEAQKLEINKLHRPDSCASRCCEPVTLRIKSSPELLLRSNLCNRRLRPFRFRAILQLVTTVPPDYFAITPTTLCYRLRLGLYACRRQSYSPVEPSCAKITLTEPINKPNFGNLFIP